MVEKATRAEHEKIVNSLVARLKQNNKYNAIGINISYNVNGIEGDVDVLTYNSDSKTYHFYEVKVNYTSNTYSKALHQFKNYRKAYPERNVKGIFVSKDRVRRLK